ncbi:MAG: Crp/Fnr family transcriptional regulator [Leptolyngbya sp. SIO1D8]|nr:Crp/Fnr family transcriptional regulator [Leptolyngbya sp. SIO1D8]
MRNQPVTGYLVIQGRVRLLCKSGQRQRPCSATVLRAGDIFGADHLFFKEPLSYFAVAASDCQVASVSLAQLTDVIGQYPALRNYWHKQIQRRAQQIFFKCFTQLQPLSSKALSHLLPSRIREHHVGAGVPLRVAITPYEGYFWLRSGVLSCPTVSEHTVPIGTGWSDRNQQIAESVAQTPLMIYQLQLQPWETAEMIPVLAQLDL